MILGLTEARDRRFSPLSRSDSSSSSAAKSKLLNLLTVCLAASGLLVPAQAAFGHDANQRSDGKDVQHLVCVKQGQQLLCDVQTSPDGDERSELTQSQGSVQDAKATQSPKSNTALVVPQLITPAQQAFIENILLGLSYFLPCGLVLGLFLYDKYSAYRLAVLDEQVERLEKLWQKSTQR
jgi:hypothetical protein